MKLLYTILFLLTSYVTSAQTGEVHGTVFDEKKQPIVGAVVQVSQGRKNRGRAVTDTDGHFLIKPLTAGVYLLQCCSVSYPKVRIGDITVGKSRVIQNVYMKPPTHEIEVYTQPCKTSISQYPIRKWWQRKK